jgi:hypothetical protein
MNGYDEMLENFKSKNKERVLELSQELIGCEDNIRACDPIEVWEKHPVVSKYLDMKDKDIAFAIDLSESMKNYY